MTELWKSDQGIFCPSCSSQTGYDLQSTGQIFFLALALSATIFLTCRIVKSKAIKKEEWHISQHLNDIGYAITSMYFIGMFFLFADSLYSFSKMPLNEAGDFLAGAFGPIAFFWLVLGYMQQGEELRQGNKALELQTKALNDSVTHQSDMAKVAKAQFDAQSEVIKQQRLDRDRLLQADFSIYLDKTTDDIANQKIMLANDGNTAKNINIRFGTPFEQNNTCFIPKLKNEQTHHINTTIPRHFGPVDGDVTIEYYDLDRNKRSERFGFVIECYSISFIKKD